VQGAGVSCGFRSRLQVLRKLGAAGVGPIRCPPTPPPPPPSRRRSLHNNGIQVILDVVYNHTAELDDKNPYLISFRGIDCQTYYMVDTTQYIQVCARQCVPARACAKPLRACWGPDQALPPQGTHPWAVTCGFGARLGAHKLNSRLPGLQATLAVIVGPWLVTVRS
jgi:hypothetical protein